MDIPSLYCQKHPGDYLARKPRKPHRNRVVIAGWCALAVMGLSGCASVDKRPLPDGSHLVPINGRDSASPSSVSANAPIAPIGSLPPLETAK